MAAQHSASRSWATLGVRLAIMTLMALVPLGILSFFQSRITQTQAQELSLRAQLEQANSSALIAMQTSKTVEYALQFISSSLSLIALRDAKTCESLFHYFVQGNMRGAQIAFVLPSGISPCNSQLQPLNLARAPYFSRWRNATQSDIFTSPTWPGVATGPVLVFVQPVFNSSRDLIGEVILAVPMPFLYNTQLPTTFNAQIYLLDQQGRINSPTQIPPKLRPARDLRFKVLDDPHSKIEASKTHELVILTSFKLSDQVHLLQIARLDSPDTFGQTTLGYLLPIITWLLTILIIVFGTEHLVTRHIRKLSQEMDSFSQGQHRLPNLELRNAPFEISTLAASYQQMVTKTLQDEEKLRQLAQQKSDLLQEVHHRTGNSLQLIASVMRMHLRENPAPETRLILNDLHNRVMSLSSVHLGLYRMAGRTQIAADALLNEVITKIRLIYGHGAPRSRTISELAPMLLSAEQAVPLALFLAEVLAAFPLSETDLGQIRIRLSTGPDDTGCLAIIGPAAARSRLNGERFGAPAVIAAKLIQAFADQINGHYEILDLDGDRIEVRLIFKNKSPNPPDL